ncbi:MAG: hypothetical protein D6806_05365, partial [Deltaproteobacteria bacterium]
MQSLITSDWLKGIHGSVVFSLLFVALAARGQEVGSPSTQDSRDEAETMAGKESPSAANESRKEGDTVVEWPVALQMMEKAVSGLSKVALFPPEATGTAEDVSGVTHQIAGLLEGKQKPALLGPEKTLECAGAEFPLEKEGLAQAAERCNADAILLVRIFRTPSRYEIRLW